jgi:predicted nucleic acid-binding protein
MYFVDTNVFLRYLTNDDDPIKGERCRELLKKADAKQVELATHDAIVAEIVYVLESKKENGYALARGRIRELLYPLILIRGLRLPNRKAVLRALDLYAETTLDFEDALLVAYAETRTSRHLYSYDAGIDAVPSVVRSEP